MRKILPKRSPVKKKNKAADLSPSVNSFFVVGIGASAGGLETLEKFFEKMPAISGMAFIIVTHLDPNHVSIMP